MSDTTNIIHSQQFDTPLGPMVGAATDEGVCLLEFTDRRRLNTEYKELRKYFNAEIIPGTHPLLDQLKTEMEEYYAGTRTAFSVPLNAPGTEFQKKVWDQLLKIPYGTTNSYQQLSEILGDPKAIRAVANANGHNRIAIIIPCHRIIGSDGSMTGYGGGLKRKRWLLDHERLHSGQSVQLELEFGE